MKTMNQDKLFMNHYVHDKVSVYRLPKDVIVYSGLFFTGDYLDLVERLLLSMDFLRYARLDGIPFVVRLESSFFLEQR